LLRLGACGGTAKGAGRKDANARTLFGQLTSRKKRGMPIREREGALRVSCS
jgi:hypothetical protein